MKELLIKITKEGTTVTTQISADGKLFQEKAHFMHDEYAEGMMADEFNHHTGNRYKEPTKLSLKGNLLNRSA